MKQLAKSRRSKRVRFRTWSRLARIIFAVNLTILFLMFLAFTWADRSLMRLIDARKEALATQGELIAGALAESAVRDDTAAEEVLAGVETQVPLIDRNEANNIIRRLVLPTKTRARLYDFRGDLLADSKLLMSGGSIDRMELEPPKEPQPLDAPLNLFYGFIKGLFANGERLPYVEAPPDLGPQVYPELQAALDGTISSADRYSERDELIVVVAIPVQRLRVTLGALLLTTEGQDIEAITRQDDLKVAQFALIVFATGLALSWYLSIHISGPIRRLAQAADKVAAGPAGKAVPIPDLSRRNDEIGDLSLALRHMTEGLFDRIEAIERFAADVSHEIKNPLTSIKSAVETLQHARKPEDQARLIEIVKDDVRRLDRLITDIADASRLDAELARANFAALNLPNLLRGFVDTVQSTRREAEPNVELQLDLGALAAPDALILGHETRLAQVIHNLVANARSFSPKEGIVRLGLSVVIEEKPRLRLTVDDSGPGIPPENLETIFERFYTSRPKQEFGKNSGLGLSISRQIVEAHNGRIWAENRTNADGAIVGARFIVELPMLTVDN